MTFVDIHWSDFRPSIFYNLVQTFSNKYCQKECAHLSFKQVTKKPNKPNKIHLMLEEQVFERLYTYSLPYSKNKKRIVLELHLGAFIKSKFRIDCNERKSEVTRHIRSHCLSSVFLQRFFSTVTWMPFCGATAGLCGASFRPKIAVTQARPIRTSLLNIAEFLWCISMDLPGQDPDPLIVIFSSNNSKQKEIPFKSQKWIKPAGWLCSNNNKNTNTHTKKKSRRKEITPTHGSNLEMCSGLVIIAPHTHESAYRSVFVLFFCFFFLKCLLY